MSKAWYILFAVASTTDVITTAIGLSRGHPETRPFAIPFLTIPLYWGAVYVIDKATRPDTRTLANVLKGGLLVLAFAPTVWNTYLITKEWKAVLSVAAKNGRNISNKLSVYAV